MDQGSIPGKGRRCKWVENLVSCLLFFSRAPPGARRSGFMSQELSANRKNGARPRSPVSPPRTTGMLSSYVWVAACLAALHDLSRPLARGSRLVDLLGRPPLDVLSLASPGDPCRFEPQPRGRSPRPLPCLGLVLRGLPRLNRRVRWGVRGEASICLCRLVPSPSPGGVDRLTAPPLASLDS